jgi:D-glycero-D-manno-heptose 1,7-bisphosphate phosphatase
VNRNEWRDEPGSALDGRRPSQGGYLSVVAGPSGRVASESDGRTVTLFLFDMDGCLVRSYLREGAPRTPENYALVEVLSGRREKLERLRADGHIVAIVTNQGGVAFGYQTQHEVYEKLATVLDELGLPVAVCGTPPPNMAAPRCAYVSFGHPKATVKRWLVPPEDDWRKPGGGMLRQAMTDYGATPEDTVFIGDMDSDRAAAKAAGVRYVDVEEFFKGESHDDAGA